LSFEASGALKSASLVLRDRETDSWWSIMSSDAIGGELEGADLVELPFASKTTWKEWVARHPDTRVLSVDGTEHVDSDPYADYFASDRTFRDLEISDQRLAPKTPVFAFHLDGVAFAVPHEAFEGGARIPLTDGSGRSLLLFRESGSPLQASSRAFLVEPGWVDPPSRPVAELIRAATEGSTGLEPLAGFDTFWYSWIAVNQESELLR